MSYHVRFLFSSGLARPITAPKGTFAAMRAHVIHVEGTLDLDGPEGWRFPKYEDVEDEVLCATAIEHNRWVELVWSGIETWSKKTPPGETEMITPENAAAIWHALRPIEPPIDRWDRHYYRDRMDHLFEVMRGRPSEGVSFDERALTPKQAGAVIGLFSHYIDGHDIRLEVPKGADQLASSYDGEYEWCEKCGAVWPSDAEDCRKRGCPVRKRWREEDGE